MATDLALSLVFGYFLGATPIGVFAGRAFSGIDPRDAGSRNIGFTNVLRVAGKAAGIEECPDPLFPAAKTARIPADFNR